jgi:tetraacyldisaccharide 4'-kinase
VSILQGNTVAAFAGIARPERFFASLEQAGARLCLALPFPDHHPYTSAELDALQHDAQKEGAQYLVTSEKDAVRLTQWRPAKPLLALELSVTLDDEDRFLNRLIKLIGVTTTG